MSEKQINQIIANTRHEAQFTGAEVEVIQLGNDCYIYVDGVKTHALTCE